MGWLISFMSLVILIVIPLGNNMAQMSSQLRKLSTMDLQLSEEAETLCDTLNAALRLNAKLLFEQDLCALATTPQERALHKTLGNYYSAQQNSFLMKAQTQKMKIQTQFQIASSFPFRSPSGPCAIPGILICKTQKIFEIKSKEENLIAGVLGESSLCNEIRWQYHHKRVLPI